MNRLPLCVVGALGRMGRRLIALAPEHGFDVVGALVEPADPHVDQTLGSVLPDAGASADRVLTDQPALAMKGARVVVDFALASGLQARLDAAVHAGAAFVCGSTGLGSDEQRALDGAAAHIPLLWAPNMSTGVTLLLELVQRAARALPDFDVEIHELHHQHKADAPSGTAMALARAAASARGQDDAALKPNRGPGARQPGEIGVVASRAGEIVGEHTVFLVGGAERLELVHRAHSRDVFALGALRAARFLVDRPAGRFTMADVLGSVPAA
ncbi:MAG: 4-hydroxy-tetrahydrodipicolinate reductase [Pseudomonadota bacterium]